MNTFKKIKEILNMDYSEFNEKYYGSVIGTGERTCDFVKHFIELDENVSMFISFVDFDIHSYSIIDKRDSRDIFDLVETINYDGNPHTVFQDLQRDHYYYLVVFDNFITFVSEGQVKDNFVNFKPVENDDYYKSRVLGQFKDKTYFKPLGEYDSFDIGINRITLIQKLHKLDN